MNTHYAAALTAAAAHPSVTAAMQGASGALARLRFHEGLRRRWENARAEAAIREATALALLEGARISVSELRAASMADTPSGADPASLLAVGIWRSQWNVASRMEPLNVKGPRRIRPAQPLPARIGAIHRDVCSALLAAGHIPAQQVAMPTSPGEMRALMSLMRADVPAVALAGEVWARLRSQPAFSVGSGAVGAALAREILVERGVDPSGVAVLSMWHTLNPVESAGGLDAWKAAQTLAVGAGQERVEYLAQWLTTFVRALEAGAGEGGDVALHIQAGRLGR